MMEPPPPALPISEMDMFEPLQRARSNTWPLPRPEDYDQPPSVKTEPGAGAQTEFKPGPSPPVASAAAAALKKNSSRRNAWGNLSYADLITQAIGSAPDSRLTLSQIYEWMVQNVPYFKDKGDSNSSAGWKNSIRHNLSLHNRFMRVQNEGTGKSSWWMINPDAKPGKSARRRATSMETSKFERKRGRVKKKVEALRNGLDATPSPSSSVSESLDLFPESPLPGFQLSPDFRTRASSNASSCGRLSPIPAVEPADWSPAPPPSGFYAADQLACSLESNMRLEMELEQQPPRHFMYPTPPPYQPPAPAPPHFPYPCPLHRGQPCNCLHHPAARQQSVSPSSYPQSPSPSPPASTMMGQLMGALNTHPAVLDDLNLNLETLPGGFECNVEEVIRHELSMDGNLDFNFSQQQTSAAAAAADHHGQPYPGGRSWVH